MQMMRVAVGGLAVLVAGLLGTGAAWGQTIHCASADGTKKYCEADTTHGVNLVKQVGANECKQGESWGYDAKGIWVDRGCAAEFAAGAGTGAEGSSGAAGSAAESKTAALPPGTKTLTCSSDGAKIYCDASTGRGVRLVKQVSTAECKKDDSWGYDGLGIWVDKGCGAEFALNVAPKAASEAEEETGTTAKDKTCLAQAGKARAEQMVKQCLKVSVATHPPCNVQNSCELIEDEIRRSCAMMGLDAPTFCNGYR